MPAGGKIEYVPGWAKLRAEFGSIVHRWLQRIAEEGVKSWSPARIQGLHNTLKFQLAAIGVNDADRGRLSNVWLQCLSRQ